jgi:hypothetical protein
VGIEKDRYVEAEYLDDGYFAEPLLIGLTEDEATAVGRPIIDAISLARLVLEYWNTGAKLA